MLTYLIEDSPPKVEKIVSFLREHYPHFDVRVHGSYHSGLSAIERQPPDLVVLDMTLPNFDRQPGVREGRLRPLGGYDLMRKLKLRGLRPKIVIVTQLEEFGEEDEKVTFAEIVQRCETEFADQLVGAVYFSQGANADWQSALTRVLNAL